MPKFINTELESKSESELESDTELESNSEQQVFFYFFADFGQISYFADFEQVKNFAVILLSIF